MISKYENFDKLSSEINKFIKIINIDTSQKDLIHVTKIIIFFKQVILSMDDTYYGRCLLSDILQMINLLHYNSKRLFYMVYRSAIENSLRFISELKEDDDTGINQLLEMTKDLCGVNAKDNYSFIKHQYKIGCGFTHSNINSGLNLYEYYSDSMKVDSLTVKEIIDLFEIEKRYLDKLLDLLIKIRVQWIDHAFYRENQKLKYLLTESKFKKYKEYLEKCN